jgi:proteasome accessory factor C
MSGKVSERLNRLLVMVPYLAREEGAGVDELCREFGITEPELMHDLDTLRMCGVPDYTPADLMDYWIEGGRVHVMMADYFARPLNMTRQEALSLFVAGSALVRSGVFEEKGPLDSALAKIELLLSAETKEELEKVISHIEVEMRAYEGNMREIIDEGLEKGMNLELGWCHLSEDMRLFRLDRIASVRLTDNACQERVRESFDIPTVVGEYSPGRKAHQVRLTFEGKQGRRITEQWPAAQVSENADGTISVELRTRNLAWLETYLLRFGGRVRVEGPKELKKMLAKKAGELLESYS